MLGNAGWGWIPRRHRLQGMCLAGSGEGRRTAWEPEESVVLVGAGVGELVGSSRTGQARDP